MHRQTDREGWTSLQLLLGTTILVDIFGFRQPDLRSHFITSPFQNSP